MKLCRLLFLLIINFSIVKQGKAAQQLQFSPQFFDAVAGCRPFSENVSANNPDFAAYLAPDLAGLKIDFSVQILEPNKPQSCQILFTQKIDKMGTSTAQCQISDEQREAFLYALRNTSDKIFTDTFEILPSDDDSTAAQITLSGNLLHIVYHKILSTSCVFTIDNVAAAKVPDTANVNKTHISLNAPSKKTKQNDVDKEKIVVRDTDTVSYAVFPPQFMKSWQLCQPDEIEQNLDGTLQKLIIIGKKNNHCQAKFGKFDLNIPSDLMANIHSFADVKAILKNEDIAKYPYKPKYTYKGLIYALDACLQKKGYDGDAKTTSKDGVIIRRGLFSQYSNQQCIFHLQNEVDINGHIHDYSVLCYLSDKMLRELHPYFKDMIAAYGRKRSFTSNGKVKIQQAEFNKETDNGDIALMFYLQQNGLCKRAQ